MITTDTHLEGVVRAVTNALRSVVENVVLVSYGGDFVEIATLPALILYLPIMNRQRTEFDNIPEQVVSPDGLDILLYKPPRYYDLLFRYELAADPLTLARLIESLAVLYEETPTIQVARANRAGDLELLSYRLEESQEAAPAAGDGRAQRMAGQFAIRGVALRLGASTPGKVARTLALTFERKGG